MTAMHARQPTLDMLRGIAILAVLCFHFDLRSGVAALDALLVPIVRTGWAGVDIFFVLSGFLVGRMILVESASRGGFAMRRFFVRRAMRLWPALAAYLGLMVLAGHWQLAWPTLLHLQNYIGPGPSHLWSLAVEEHFYLAAAFALPWLARGGVQRLVIGLLAILALCLGLRIAAAAAGVGMVHLQWQTQYRVDSLAFGVLLAALQLYRPAFFARIAARRGACVAAAIGGFAILALAGDGLFRHTIGFTIAYLAAAAALLAMHDLVVPRALARPARALGWVGTIAYSLYIWHANVGFGVAAQASALGLAHPLALFATQLTAAIAVAGALHALIERPFMRLRDRPFRPRHKLIASHSQVQH